MYVMEMIKHAPLQETKLAVRDRGNRCVVKVTHSKSGITVTTYSRESVSDAKEKAIIEIEEIISFWEGW